jgi:hypothetical protein
VVKIWLGQYRQPRYMLAGVVHIIIFAGFPDPRASVPARW